MFTQQVLNSIFLTIISLFLGGLVTWFWRSREAAVRRAEKLASEHGEAVKRIYELERKQALLDQAVIPISTAFQAILVKELTHYHTPELDSLLTKLGPPNTLTQDEESRMLVLLEARTKDMGPLISEKERGAATILPEVIKRARAEDELLTSAETLKLKLVTVAAVLGLPVKVPDSIEEVKEVPLKESSTAQSLKKIEEHTATTAEAAVSTAESLATLTQRATDKLADKAVKNQQPKRRKEDGSKE